MQTKHQNRQITKPTFRELSVEYSIISQMNDKKTSVMGLKKSLWTDDIRGRKDQVDCKQSLEGLITVYQAQGRECASRKGK